MKKNLYALKGTLCSSVNESKENLVFSLENHFPPCLLSVPYFVQWMFPLKAVGGWIYIEQISFFSRKASLCKGIF